MAGPREEDARSLNERPDIPVPAAAPRSSAGDVIAPRAAASDAATLAGEVADSTAAAATTTTGPAGAIDRPAWRDAGAWARFGLVAAAGLALDLWSKHELFARLGQTGRIVLLPGVLEFQTMMNKGALFGIGAGQTTLFLAASVLALLLVGWMFVHSSPRRWLLHVALGGIVAGALGNMYDRVFVRLVETPQRRPDGAWVFVQRSDTAPTGVMLEEYPPGRPGGLRLNVPSDSGGAEVGFVRDFIKIPTKLWGERDLWPWVFNVADMLLVGGVIILALYLLYDGRQQRKAPPPVGT